MDWIQEEQGVVIQRYSLKAWLSHHEFSDGVDGQTGSLSWQQFCKAFEIPISIIH